MSNVGSTKLIYKVLIEDESVDTFGIIATDNQQNEYVFEDITTFYEKLEEFVDFLNREKPTINCFKILLDNFMENL